MKWCGKRVFELGAPCHMAPGHDGECDHAIIVCGLCGDPTPANASKRCDHCAKLEEIARTREVPR